MFDHFNTYFNNIKFFIKYQNNILNNVKQKN